MFSALLITSIFGPSLFFDLIFTPPLLYDLKDFFTKKENMTPIAHLSKTQQVRAIIESARVLEKEKKVHRQNKKITALVENINKFVSTYYPLNPRTKFFFTQLKVGKERLLGEKPSNISNLANKVERAARYILGSFSPSDILRFRQLTEPSDQLDEPLVRALYKRDQATIRYLTKNLEQIHPQQLIDLFNWATEEPCDFVVIKRILKKWHLPDQLVNQLVHQALEINQFDKIAYPIILLNYSSLAESVRARLDSWIHDLCDGTFQKIANELLCLQLTLSSITSKMGVQTVTIYKEINSKLQLEKLIKQIAFPAIQEEEEEVSALAVASSIWGVFVSSWKTKELNEVEEDIKTILELLGTLEEDGHPAHIARPAPTYGSLGPDLASPIFPRSLSKSSPRNSTAEQEDEKSSPPQLNHQIHQLIEQNSPRDIRNLLSSREATTLSEGDFAEFIEHAIDKSPLLLTFVLSSPHFKITTNAFFDFLYRSCEQNNWDAARELLACSKFEQLTFEQVLPLFPLINNADAKTLILFNNSVATLL